MTWVTACWHTVTCSGSMVHNHEEDEHDHDDNNNNDQHQGEDDHDHDDNNNNVQHQGEDDHDVHDDNNNDDQHQEEQDHGDHDDNDNNDQHQEEDDNDNENDIDDPLVWSKDLERHSCGEFSYAVVQANLTMEDHSQVETGSNAIFVGIYDGHNGPYAAKYITRKLFDHVIGIAREYGTISEQTLEEAIYATEQGFVNLVQRAQDLEPLVTVAGSCCLVGVIWKGTLLIAHLGVSRAVHGFMDDDPEELVAVQMTSEHDVNNFWVRQEVIDANLDDPDIVVEQDGVWLIKGITKMSRSIGDAYLKWSDFQLNDPSLEEFQFLGPVTEDAISIEPNLQSRALEPADRFFVFASHGFWEHITNQRVGEIINNNRRMGIAKRLVKAAQKEAARKANIRYSDLHNIDKGNRRTIHDDMTVVVVFIDHELIGQKDTTLQQMSIKGFNNLVAESNFRNLDNLM